MIRVLIITIMSFNLKNVVSCELGAHRDTAWPSKIILRGMDKFMRVITMW